MGNPNKFESDLILGINGFGRIGKLTLWHHVGRKYFGEIVINVGRDAGTSLHDLAHYLERDSTYGLLAGYLYGHKGTDVIKDVDEKAGTMSIDGTRVRILRDARNPKDIGWHDHNVQLVVDTTGQFLDPGASPDDPKGSIRGHFEAGAKKVIASAPFKIKDKAAPMPDDAVTSVMGINENDYDPRVHNLISNASCTTTCLAHMIRPLLDAFGVQRILTASMSTIHAVTGSQQVLDRLPKTGATDLRKNRSVMNNIILTTTGAANTLGLVIPEMKQIGFIAESVRIPTSTGSLIILVVNLQEESSGESIRRDVINGIYRDAADRDPRGYLKYSDKQNVSCDIIGLPRAAAMIEGNETHTRTANVNIDLQKVSPASGNQGLPQGIQGMVSIAITQTVIYGWYDNEMGSYVNMLGDRTVSIADVL